MSIAKLLSSQMTLKLNKNLKKYLVEPKFSVSCLAYPCPSFMVAFFQLCMKVLLNFCCTLE